jgi:hypothetical protein
MATTWMKALHRSGGIAAALGRSVDYIGNPEKTDDGELIEGYECDPFTAQSEFLLSKKLYAQKTGRDQGRHDVIAYHLRMSFKPGEVTAEQALALGHELALRWTKGMHQFIVAAHTNTGNPHVHIIFNSVNLDCTRKFEDFKRSAIALRRVSDRICLEHGLSVIEKPGLSKGYNRAEYLGGGKAPSARDTLRGLIDTSLREGDSFDGFLAAMVAAGCEVKCGKHLAFKISGGKKFIRCNSLGEDYTEDALRERLAGKRIVTPKQETAVPALAENKPNLLIDIQEKMRQGKGEGYRRWGALFNLKEMSKTLIFLQESGIDSYDDLVVQSTVASADFSGRLERIKTIEARIRDIAELQKQIGVYGKTREVYVQHKMSGWSEDFYEAHHADITLHKAAKKHFDSLGLKKLPSMQSLKQEYAGLLAEKKKLYSGYHETKEKSRALLTAKRNAEQILGVVPETKNHGKQHRIHDTNSHEL